jgi:DNA modification methylase
MTVPAIPTVEDMPLEQLREWPRNPRRISKPRLEQLKRALEAEPEMLRARPLIALPDGTVVAGNQRLRAARELGWPSLPVVVVDLDDARASEWALRDNRGYGEDDEALVGALLAELAASGRDLDLSGYDSGEVDRLLAAVRSAPVVDPDDAPPLPAVPRSERGEVYELGPHRVMCGDATNADHMNALMHGAIGHLVYTDPPYGVDYSGGMKPRERMDGDGRHTSIYDASIPLMLEHTARRAAFYIWYADLSTAAAAAAAAGLTVRCQIVWAKNHAQFMSAAHYHGKHEPMIYAARHGVQPRWYGPKNEVTLWEYDRASRNDLHPTQKPVAIAERVLANSSAHGDFVLDCFGGSGSTLIAAQTMGRRARLMELEPAYVDVIRQRYADFTGQPELAP